MPQIYFYDYIETAKVRNRGGQWTAQAAPTLEPAGLLICYQHVLEDALPSPLDLLRAHHAAGR